MKKGGESLTVTVTACVCGNTGKYIDEVSNPNYDNRCYAKHMHRIKCPVCGRTTAWHEHLYHAVVEWNGQEDSEA